MRRLVGWVAGALGGITAYRFLRRRQVVEPAPTEPDGRANELRAKLAESRDEEPTAREQPEPESPEDRRRRVHEEGRAALDDMKGE
jgi:hypothetical protein